MKSALVFLFLMSFSVAGLSLTLTNSHKREFLKLGGNSKAFAHLNCFVKNFARDQFQLKSSNRPQRCNSIDSSNGNIEIENTEYAVIVDYTQPSNERRMYILNLKNRNEPLIETYYVSHGRFGSTPYNNQTLSRGKNSVLDIEYFSNVLGSNASSTGFYITGQIYQGSWVGPRGDKFSLVLHGISRQKNDNACERLVVVHGNAYVKESGTSEGVRRMSSGCFMLDYDHVNEVVDKIRGGGGEYFPGEAMTGGAVFFTYGPAEAALPKNYYCSRQSLNELRVD